MVVFSYNRILFIDSVVSSKLIYVYVADTHNVPSEESLNVSMSPSLVYFTNESKLVRTPRPGHPCIVVQSEVPPEIGGRAGGSSGTPSTSDSSRPAFVFPPVAIYCHPPSPSVSSILQRPSAATADDEAATPAKQMLGARLSVPTDAATYRRRPADSSSSLSRSQSHPLHRHRHRRSRPTTADVDDDEPHQQTEPLIQRTS